MHIRIAQLEDECQKLREEFHTAGVILKTLLNLQDNFKRIENELSEYKNRTEVLTQMSEKHPA